MLYFTVSTGIGGGVILDGKLRRGAHGMAGEFGHVILEGAADAPQYAAGKPGALEALASGPAIEREGRAALGRAKISVPENFSTKSIFDAAQAGGEWAVETRRRCVAQLGRGIAAMVCAYDVERVIVGGGVSAAGDALFVAVARGRGFLSAEVHERKDRGASGGTRRSGAYSGGGFGLFGQT